VTKIVAKVVNMDRGNGASSETVHS